MGYPFPHLARLEGLARRRKAQYCRSLAQEGFQNLPDPEEPT